MKKLNELVSYLDEFLRVTEVPDFDGALNGLQIANSGRVTKIAAAVDACRFTAEEAARQGADLLLVHHGIFWAKPFPLTGRQYARFRPFFAADVALYSSHLPLDAHPEVGNNAVLARSLGLKKLKPFGDIMGIKLGFSGTLPRAVSRNEFAATMEKVVGGPVKVFDFGPQLIRTVGIITGGGGGEIKQAVAAGLDAYVTGEGSHPTFLDAEELGGNLFYGGHYKTETFGVCSLAAHIERKFKIPWVFIDHPTGM
jgi:dinuclear metal center YbgI/SA1388 family protein